MAKASSKDLLPEIHTGTATNMLELLNKEFEAKKSELIGKVASEFAEKFNGLKTSYDALPVDIRKSIFNQPAFDLILSALGLQLIPVEATKKGKGGPKTPRAEMNDEAIIKLLKTGSKTKSELVAHFAGGSKKVVEKLTAMVKAKKLSELTGQGPKKNGTVYSVA